MKKLRVAVPLLLVWGVAGFAAQQQSTPSGAPEQGPGQNSPDTQQDKATKPHSDTKQDATVAKPDSRPKPKNGKPRNPQSHGPQRHDPNGQS